MSTSSGGFSRRAAAVLLGALLAGGAAAADRIRLDVPFFPDTTDQCGPSALAAVLAFWGDATTPQDLKSEVYLEQLRGALPMDLMLAARRRGFQSRLIGGGFDDLKDALRQGHPPIVFTNRGFDAMPVGHFMVVTGYDEERGGFTVHSGGDKDLFMSYARFAKDWDKTDRSTLLIQPSDEDQEVPHERS